MAAEPASSSNHPLLWPDLPSSPRRGSWLPKLAPVRHKASALRAQSALLEPVIFLDIETTGLSRYYDEITLVGYAMDRHYDVHVAGDDPERLVAALKAARSLVTFNGTLFDLPFLRKAFCGLELPSRHVDLRYLAKRAGLTGGQKAVESRLGVVVRKGLDGVDGAEAVLLWHQYLRGDRAALRRLIAYNEADVIGMAGILDKILERLGTYDLLAPPPCFAERFSERIGWARPDALLPCPTRLGRMRPNFRNLFANTPAESATVVGIDLTGSEAKPSGVCVLRGDLASTAMVGTDDNLVQLVVDAAPSLVSIDSPLSLPRGRIRVSDDDPGREQFGIMRACERTLKRRGINVYPCLIHSMQKLTNRGMRLAKRLRAAGIPVIESYPGAAQDILGIPRKGAGQQWLKRGLAEFGIDGSYVTTAVKHDELDAVTSALVGSFFLAGRYEGLGEAGEDFLIVPDLDAAPGPPAIGVSGRIAAGKTTISRIVERMGFAYTRFSLVIDDEIRSRGLKPDRATRQEVGYELHQGRGQRWLCERVLDRVGAGTPVIIDGLRWPEDVAFFRERFGTRFTHIHVGAAKDVRAERYRAKSEDDTSFEVADRNPVESGVDNIAALADVRIVNDRTLGELENTVGDIAGGVLVAKSREMACGGYRSS